LRLLGIGRMGKKFYSRLRGRGRPTKFREEGRHPRGPGDREGIHVAYLSDEKKGGGSTATREGKVVKRGESEGFFLHDHISPCMGGGNNNTIEREKERRKKKGLMCSAERKEEKKGKKKMERGVLICPLGAYKYAGGGEGGTTLIPPKKRKKKAKPPTQAQNPLD